MKPQSTMKTPLVLLALLLPACQTELKDQNRDLHTQLDAMRTRQQRLINERDMALGENSELKDRLSMEQGRTSELQDRLKSMEASVASHDDEVEGIRSRLEGTGVEVGRRGGFIVLDLPSAITFPSGSATLTKNGRKSLNTVSGVLKSDYKDRTFWVEGHTDNDPITKSSWKSNLQLSVMRALAVAEELTGKLGVDPSQVRVAGHGPFSPKASNDTKEGKAANRRVEILILN